MVWCVCAAVGALIARFSVRALGIVCTSAGFLIVSNHDLHTLSAVHIATGVVEQIDLGTTELNWPLGLALSEGQRVVYIANTGHATHQIKTVALPDRYFTDT